MLSKSERGIGSKADELLRITYCTSFSLELKDLETELKK